MRKNQAFRLTILAMLVAVFASCITPAKLDAHVADQYGNQLPRQNKKLKSDIVVNSTTQAVDDKISHTKKRNKQLPLIVYWSYDYRHTCTLNPGIAVSSFSNTVNSMSGKLSQKLNGRRLELTVEQVPTTFALVDKGHIILLMLHWDRIYMQPDRKDLIVSYKVLDSASVAKEGRITVKTLDQDKGIRFAQSWKSSTSEYLGRYNANLATMSKSFVAKLLEEL